MSFWASHRTAGVPMTTPSRPGLSPEPARETTAVRHPARWRPWHGRPRARDMLCALAIVVSGVYAVATIPLTPALIASHPVLLELLTGSTSSIMAAGAFSDVDARLQLALVVVAALPGIMRFDWVFWWAGRLWGHRIVERLGHRSPRMARLAGLAEARGRRWARPARRAIRGLRWPSRSTMRCPHSRLRGGRLDGAAAARVRALGHPGLGGLDIRGRDG